MSKRRHKHEEHEEHVNHERWLVTYADMITLLMVLFIVLFAMGQTDIAKYKKLRQSLAVGFGGPDKMALMDGGSGLFDGGASPVGVTPAELAAKTAISTLDKRAAAWKQEKARLDETKSSLDRALKQVNGSPLIADSQVRVAVGTRGLVITIESDIVLFEPGSATIRPEGQAVLNRIADQLVVLPNHITVEGHTDNVPISGVFPSNWELSTARASSVLRSLIALHGLDPSKGTAAGYADQKRVAPNDTAKGRAKNRRVEIVVEARVSDPMIDSPDAVAAVQAAAAAEAKDRAGEATPVPNVTVPAASSTISEPVREPADETSGEIIISTPIKPIA